MAAAADRQSVIECGRPRTRRLESVMIKCPTLACCLISFAAGCNLRDGAGNECPPRLETDRTEAAKALARRWFDEVINERHIDVIPAIYAADYVHHGPAGAEIRGLEAVRVFAASILAASEDRRAVVEQQVAEGDLVVTRFISRGRRTGVLQGIEPSGEAWTTEGIVISRIEDGKIAEDWEITHHTGF